MSYIFVMVFPILSQYSDIENILRNSVLANVSSLTSIWSMWPKWSQRSMNFV